MSLINEQQVVLDLMGADRHEATRTLAERLVASGRCTDLDTFLGDVRKREETMATGLPGGIGIPHARSEGITEPSLVFGRVADGICIRLPFPKPTEERRKELVKECNKMAEEARVSIRNVRRDVNAKIERDEELPEDQQTREKKSVQKLTDSYVEKIDELLKTKTSEVMEI